MRISDWSSDVCSSDLVTVPVESVLHLGGIDVLAAGDDHVLEAIDDEQVAAVVDVPHVAGAESAAVDPWWSCWHGRMCRWPRSRSSWAIRTAERRVGEECVRKCISGGVQAH